MIWSLARRHEIIQELPKAAVVAAVTSGLALNVLGVAVFRLHDAGRSSPLESYFPLLQACVFISLAGLFVKGRAERRCRTWEASLPLTARDLWFAHGLALLLAASALILLAWTMIFGVFGLIISLDRGTPLVGMREALGILAGPLAFGVLATGIIMAFRPDEARLDRTKRWRLSAWLLLAGLTGSMLLSARIGAAAYVAAAAAGILLATTSRGRVGTALRWAPVSEASLSSPEGAVAEWSVSGSARIAWFAVARLVAKWPMTWLIGLPMAAVFGLLLGGWSPSGESQPELRWSNVFISSYLLFAFAGHFMENLHRVDHLPVGRRRLLMGLLLPGMLTMAASYGTARLIVGRTAAMEEPFRFDNGAEDYGLKVPPELFRFSPGGDVPLITAPWGETAEPTSVAVFAGLPGRLWKPYTTPAGASVRFVGWQIGRAAEAYYGGTFDAAELATRYLEVDDEGTVVVVSGGLTLAADHPGASPLPDGPAFAFYYGLVVLMTLWVAAAYFRVFRPGVTLRRSRVAFWFSMGLLLSAHIAGFAVQIAGLTDDWIVSGLIAGGLRKLGGPGGVGWTLYVLATAALVAVSWLLAERMFRRAEVLRTGGGCSML